MKRRVEVKIALLKGKLSEYLKMARRGEEVIVYDRDTPIVILMPYPDPKNFTLKVEGPEEDPLSLCKIKGKKFGKPNKTSLEILLEDRESE